MALLKQKLSEFFSKNKQKLTHAEITICMGNEGCDLDSFISSLIVSYAENFIHVVPMKKEVFVTKGEIMYICNNFGININQLIFLERPMGVFSKNARIVGTNFKIDDTIVQTHDKDINLVLTDHNQPLEEFRDKNVEMIIDHHILQNNIQNAKRIYIDTDVGSATTLVSKYLGHDLSKKMHCFNINSYKTKDRDVQMLCAQLAHLLIIPIIVDTNFLTKRTSLFDFLEYKKLKKISAISKNKLKKEYKIIKKARKNDHNFETKLILQKDFKKYYSLDYTFGMSVIKYKFEKWIDRESNKIKGLDKNKTGLSLYLELQSFKDDMGLDFFCVSTKMKGERTIILIDFPYIKHLQKNIVMHKFEFKGMFYYKIDVKMTRKMLVPMILDILNKNKNN